MHEQLLKLIREQQGEDECTPVFMIGEQLLEMAEGNAHITELLVADLQTDGMTLKDAAAGFKKYADKNRKGKSQFCITPKVADKLLREFYGLPSAEERTAPEQHSESFVDLADFI